MSSYDILEFSEENFQTVKETDTINQAVSLMSENEQSELVVVDAKGEFKGKINLKTWSWGVLEFKISPRTGPLQGHRC